MTSTFLAKVQREAAERSVAHTHVLRTAEDMRGLSYYTLCALADTMGAVDPTRAIPARGEVWALDVDALGNFVRAECLGRVIPREDPR